MGGWEEGKIERQGGESARVSMSETAHMPHKHRKSKWSKIFITVSRDKRCTDVFCIVLFLTSKFEIISK